jgi:diguanylate cyclase (GGDEF)-like protein/PAS domain S-box-containing protein
MEEEVRKAPEQGALLSINNLPGGVGVYELGDSIRATYLSRGLAKLLLYTSKEYHNYSELNLLDSVHPQDAKRVRSTFVRLRKNLRELDLEFRIKSSEEHWIRILGKFARFHGQFPVYYLVASDTTEARQSSLLLEQQNARLQFAFSHSTLEMWEYHSKHNTVTTLSRTILAGNPPLHGEDPLKLLKDRGIIHPSYVETVKQDFKMLRQEAEADSIFLVKSADQSYRWVRASYSFIKGTDVALGIFSDVHDEIETRLQMLGKHRSFFAAFQVENGHPVLANERVRSMLGPSGNFYDVYEKVLFHSLHAECRERFASINTAQRLKDLVQSGKKELTIEARMQHPSHLDKGYRFVRFSLSISSFGGTSIAYIAIQDIHEQKESELELLKRAQRDPLSQLFNRLSLEELITQHLTEEHDKGGAFFLIDIDLFKQINDTYGHELGDQIIKHFSTLMQTFFPKESVIGRLGGDEFVVFLPRCTTQDPYEEMGNAFCRHVEKNKKANIACTCSIGLSFFPTDGKTFQNLYRCSDLSLYRSKEKGRNQCTRYDKSMDRGKPLALTNHAWILDNLPDSIYLCDSKTYELLFLNKQARERFSSDTSYQGKRCYEVLYKRETPCTFCKLNELSYNTFLHWVMHDDQGNSILCKETLVDFNDRLAKITVLVDQVQQAKTIAMHTKEEQKVVFSALASYLANLHFGGESWDYDVTSDLLTFLRIQHQRPQHVSIPAFLHNPNNQAVIHPSDILPMSSYLKEHVQTASNTPTMIRLKTGDSVYEYHLLTCNVVGDANGGITRLGGQLTKFAAYGFEEHTSLMPPILFEMSVALLVLSFGSELHYLFSNRMAHALLALDQQLLQDDALAWLKTEERTLFLKRMSMLQQNTERSAAFTIETKNGKYLHVSSHLGPRYSNDQLVTLTLQDTSRERDLVAINRRMQNLVEEGLQGIAVCKKNAESLSVHYVNATLARMLGYERTSLTSLLDANAMEIFHPEDRVLLIREIERQSLGGEHKPFRLRLLTEKGSILWCDITFRQVGIAGRGEPFSLLFEDVTEEMASQQEMKRTFDQLSFALNHNLLTGLYTRQRFYEETRRLLDAHPDERFVMVFWNVERFAVLNELLGFETGNQVLQWIAKDLRTFMHKHGLYAHLEADHFAACLPKRFCDVSTLSKVIDTKQLSSIIGYTLTVVFGIYEIEDHLMEVSQLLDRAHAAAKESRNTYHQSYAFYHPSFRSDTFNEQEVLNEMHQALKTNQFHFYLQPILHLPAKKIVSAEALVRWIHPTRGIIEPIQFIPVFERYGFITTLDLHLLEQICKYQAALLKQGKMPIPISLNLSRIDLSSRDIVERIITIVDAYELSHTLIQLEVTESAYIDNPLQMCKVVGALQEAKFTILMDDFGTGYSSLHMLYHLPLDILKIDRSFVRTFSENERSRQILATLVQLGKSMQLKVIAEGIEGEEQEKFLVELGCNHLQGYLYSKAVDVQTFQTLLERG